MGWLAWKARYLAGEFVALLVIVAYVVVNLPPRRVPDLRRLITRPSFATPHEAIVSFLDEQLELVEKAVSWLSPAGRRVADRCVTGRDGQPFNLRPGRPVVTCTRELRAVYGFDGDRRARLGELASALFEHGWGHVDDDNRTVRPAYLASRAWPDRPLGWRPSTGGPPVLAQVAQMEVRWASRDDPGNIDTRPGNGATSPDRASLTYQPIEAGGEDPGVLTERALLAHENAIMIGLRADYHQNANGKLPKRLSLAGSW